MDIQNYNLTSGGRLSLSFADAGTLAIVHGEGGGCLLAATGNVAGAWIPLRGTLLVQTQGLVRSLHMGEVLVTEHEPQVKAIGHADGSWVALLGGKRAWSQLLVTAAQESQMLPELHPADLDLRRQASALTRATDRLELESAVRAIADKLISLQTPLYEVITRCPGRTSAKRQQVFLRLHRVRGFISTCCDREIDTDVLARMASYSRGHFLRTFSSVYQETPHAFLVNQRLERARRLLHSGNLAVVEVARASGFENRSAFSRLFRRRFGTTALAMKRQIAASARHASKM